MSGAVSSGWWGRAPWVVAVADIVAFYLAVALTVADLTFALVIGSAIASMVLVGALLLTRAPGNKVDMEPVTSDLAMTTGVALAPASIGIWIRQRAAGR